MADFAALKKKKKGTNLKALTEKLDDMNKGGGYQRDERLYKPGFDKKKGEGYAVVRFLPAKEGDAFVRRFWHGFKGPGGFYGETSLSTIGEQDPVGISNGAYWQKGELEGNERLQNVARRRKRKVTYYANVYVIKDTVNPENNGQVRIMEMGKQIWTCVEKAIKPKFEDDEPIDPFDMWDGADFKIKMEGREIPDQNNPSKKVVVPNYESSEFARPSEFLEGDDDKKKELFEQTHDLSEFVKVKSFDELAERFKKVTGEAHDALVTGEKQEDAKERLAQQVDADREQDNTPAAGKSDDGDSGEQGEPEPEPAEEPEAGASEEEDDDDDALAMFKKMASG